MTTQKTTLQNYHGHVVEAYRLDRYDNPKRTATIVHAVVVEAYRLDRYDNIIDTCIGIPSERCRSLSFG